MRYIASAVVKFVVSIFEGLVSGIFKAVADALSSVPMLILYGCISIAGLARNCYSAGL